MAAWIAGPCAGDVLDEYEIPSREWSEHQASVARLAVGYADALLAALDEEPSR